MADIAVFAAEAVKKKIREKMIKLGLVLAVLYAMSKKR